MTALDGPTDPLDRMANIGDQVRALKAQVTTMRTAWPAGETFHGEDASGALRLEMTSQGRVSNVWLADDWSRRIDTRALARAVNEAIGAAQATLGDTWLDTWTDEESPAVEPEPRPRPVTLAEYRAVFPAPKTREELRAKADAVAEAREARQARERDDLSPHARPGRESFPSPSGRFAVTRSDTQLTGLDALPTALATMTPGDVGREIVAILADIERRALGDASTAGSTAPVNPLRIVREHY